MVSCGTVQGRLVESDAAGYVERVGGDFILCILLESRRAFGVVWQEEEERAAKDSLGVARR